MIPKAAAPTPMPILADWPSAGVDGEEVADEDVDKVLEVDTELETDIVVRAVSATRPEATIVVRMLLVVLDGE